MPMYDDRVMLSKYSTKIYNENSDITRAASIILALKKIRKEKEMKKFIHNKSITIKKNNSELSYTQSILSALDEWKKRN
jgi:hypothetical protein